MSIKKENCPCPKKACPRNGYCDKCLESHLLNDAVPYCVFPTSDKSLEAFYHHLKERFEPNT